MDPIGFEEIGHEHDGAEGPGDGIGPGHGSQLIDILHRNRNVGDTNDAPASQHHIHGNGGLSGATENACNAVGEC